MDKLLKDLEYSSSLNSVTLTALINVLVEKKLVSHEEMQRAFEKVRGTLEQSEREEIKG